MSKELDVAVKAAKAAGKVLLKHFETRGGKQVAKSEFDFVTEADKAAEDVIISAIRAEFPGHSILSEEIGSIDNGSEYKWVIDPLDGTKNFGFGVPLWGVSIGLEKSGEIIAGVIFLPVTGEIFTAEKGKGAFLDGKRIRVSSNKFPKCMISFGGHWAFSEEPLVKDNFYPVYQKFHQYFRITGSAVLVLSYIAAGRLDAYPCFRESPWDVAAGILLIKEAGGIATDIYGNEATPYQKHYIFANNRALYEEIRKVLKV